MRPSQRLAVALARWWHLRGRLVGAYPLLREAAGRAEVGSEEWCAAQNWLGVAATYAADMAGSLGHFTALRDAVAERGPSRALAHGLVGRSVTFLNLGRIAEAAEEGRRSLALAREIGYPAEEALALTYLSLAASCAGDLDTAVQLARQAGQIPADIPGTRARWCSSVLTEVLTEAGDLAAAERVCAAGLAWFCRSPVSRDRASPAALLRDEGYADVPSYARRRDEPLRAARQALGPARARAAEDRGTAMSLDTAAEYALLLTAPGPPAAAPGLGKLSARERELVTLVAQGRTNAQIAAQLYISVRTVSSHLDRIRDKTGCRRRADLTRLALTAGLV
jgi:DNA-binding CsgD family transcriptional regulator